MRDFEDFIKSGEVKKVGKAEALSRSLIKSSNKSVENLKRTKIDYLNSEAVTTEAYDAMRELIEAKLAFEGYKSYSHEATILFLKKFSEFKESDTNFLDILRKTRNSIKYYGKEVDIETAEKVLNFMKSILPKLKNLVENER